MNIKTKNLFKVLVIALTMLFAMALALGISGAWYNTTRQANGTFSMANGIVIDYSGFGQGTDVWAEDSSAEFLLFGNQNSMLPGDSVSLNDASIKANSSSADFFARVKLEYKFFTDTLGETEITDQIADYSAFVSTPTFASGWVNSGYNDGWFYYATGSTLNAMPKADYVNIFAASQAITLNIDAPGFNHEGGGYQYSNEILIKRIEIVLTIQTLQANTDAAAFEGWGIAAQYTDAAGVVYTQNNDETWTLTDGTALAGNSSNTTVTYSARIYTSSYSYTVLSQINNQDVVAIGDAAFLNAAQLTAVEIPTTVTSLGSRAFEGTGLTAVTLPESVEAVGEDALATNSLTEVTIENDQAVITGIETAGIPTASTINVPGAVFNDYETSLGISYTGLTQAAAPLVASLGLAYEYNSSTQSYTVTGIGECTDTSIVIPETYDDGENGKHNVTKIGWRAFNVNTYITEVNIPNNVLVIDEGAFNACFNLTSVIMGNSVLYINAEAFRSCTSLNYISLSSNLTALGTYAFESCIALTDITLPTSLLTIGQGAFHGSGLTSISIPNQVIEIGLGAFFACMNLETAIISNSVTHIGIDGFAECSKLISINFVGERVQTLSLEQGAFYGCGISEIIFPVNTIGTDIALQEYVL